MYLHSHAPDAPRRYLYFSLFSAIIHLTLFFLMLGISGKETRSEPKKEEELVTFVELENLVQPLPEMTEEATEPAPVERDLAGLMLSATGGGGAPGVLPVPPESIQEKFLIPQPLLPGIGAGLDDGIGTPLILPGEEDVLPDSIEEALPAPEVAATSEESEPSAAEPISPEPVSSEDLSSPSEPETSDEALAETEDASTPTPVPETAHSNAPDALADHSEQGSPSQKKVLAKKTPPPPKPSKEKIKKVGLLGLLGPKKKGGKFSRPLLSKKFASQNQQKNAAGKKSLPASSGTGQQFARLRKGVIEAEQRKLMGNRAGNRSRGGLGGGRRITINPGSGGGGIISAATQKNSGRLISIYNNLLQRNPNLQGNLIVEFVISPEGKVIKCHVLTSSLGNVEFEKSLVKEILRWKFPAVERGTTTVLYPLSFSPSG